MSDLFPDYAAEAAARKVDAARAEAAVLREAIGKGGRSWESASGKARRRIARWRREAVDLPEPHGAALIAVADELASPSDHVVQGQGLASYSLAHSRIDTSRSNA